MFVDHQIFSNVRPAANDDFIKRNNLNLQKSLDSHKYLIYLLENMVDVRTLPNSASFHDNCLEYRLDRRTTTYVPDKVDNVKLLLAISGSGKTRMLLELLHSNFGYFFTCNSSQADFGSGDLALCQTYCDRHPHQQLVEHVIGLLYFVRASVCNYLIDLGFNEPCQILLAQVHPVAFFGIDLFKDLLTEVLKEPYFGTKIIKPFPFAVIDEIQTVVESSSSHLLPGSSSFRPFFSPLVYSSKKMLMFPTFLLAGTGINFELFTEIMDSGTMKSHQVTAYKVISNLHPLSISEVKSYASQFLQEHRISEAGEIVSRISAFELCHGRPRFLAFILDLYMESGDIDFAIGQFVSEISCLEGELFPLKFFKRDLDKKKRSLDRTIGGDTLGRIIREGLLELIMKGSLVFKVNENNGAAAIRYGLGFCTVRNGLLHNVHVQELAVVECLRYLVPFKHVVKTLAQQIMSCPKPQMVGYLVEYLVAFALVSNYSGVDADKNMNEVDSYISPYLCVSAKSHVCFPDQMCGPDIIFKCMKTKTVYIVQVKFLKKISKQEMVNACNTTNPQRFYYKRKSNEVLKGFEDKRIDLLNVLGNLQRDGFSLQQMLFIHTGAKIPSNIQGAIIVTKENNFHFFNAIGPGIWEFLDSVRNNFD